MLHVHQLTYRLGARTLLDDAGFLIPTGAKVGLLGRNGSGKTTLFRLIQGEMSPESGTVSIPKGWKIGGVAQEAPGGEETLLDVVLAADTERTALLQEAETAEGLRRAEIEIRLSDIGSHSAPARAATILHGLGFNAEQQLRPCSSFSGGWRMRVALAATLFAAPDLLLLDEPTNYLDLEGTLWLYDYLSRYPNTIVVISHDRELLDTCVDHILHLDQGKLNLYRGRYEVFSKNLLEKRALQQKFKAKQDAERKHLQAFVDRFKAKASKARQAQSRVKRLAKMQPIAQLVEDEVIGFNFPAPARPMSGPLITMDRAATGYNERVVLDRLDLTLLPDDRIALLGSNGNGKSTFAKLVAGRLNIMKGDVRRSAKLDIAYFAQHQLDELPSGSTPYQAILDKMPGMPESKIRGKAAQFGFPGHKADTRIENLSGGEKARLLMGLAAFHGPHLLILDEPTNHLDIDSRSALMEAINDYEGAVVLISHDRFLIEACADRLWLVKDGGVEIFDGDMDNYRKLVLAQNRTSKGGKSAKVTEPVLEAKVEKPVVKQAQPLTGVKKPNLKNRKQNLEERIGKLQDLISRVDQALEDGKAYKADPVRAADLTQKRHEAAKALEQAEEQWLELDEDMQVA